MNLVTIKSSHYQNDLVVLKSRLESEGIECWYKNELTAQVLNYLPSFLVELQVCDKDMPQVQEILIEVGELESATSKLACPKCGSEKVKMKMSLIKRVKIFFAIVGTMLLNHLPVDKLFKNAKFNCLDCRHDFNP